MSETTQAVRPEWTPAHSADLYRIESWATATSASRTGERWWPTPEPKRADRSTSTMWFAAWPGGEVTTPIIIRLPGVLEHRMAELRRAFDTAIGEAGYEGGYACVYPIKVNQERHVCEAVRDFGAELGFGLEVGSNPSSSQASALTQGFNEMPLVCNGFKDAEYIETVVLASKMGDRSFRWSSKDTSSA